MTEVEESDKLSCLLDHLIDYILSLLSIKEAGRTSVLSTNWRNKWYTQPNLVFDRQCVCVNIYAPNLKFFHVVGQFEDISFENCFQLNIYLNSESIQSRLHGCSTNSLKYFVRRRHIQSLVIGNYFSKYFIAGVVPVKLPTPFINLRSLGLSMNFNDLKEISAVLSLLKSSPNIRKLKTLAQTEEQTGDLASASCCWKDIFSWPDTPLGLRHVRIENISGAKFEIKFIKFLLLYSPVLGKMTVKPSPLENSMLGRNVLKCRRASREARIFREDSS